MNRALRFAATAAAGFVAWLLLAGTLDPAELDLGAAAGLLAAGLLGRSTPVGRGLFNPLRLLRALAYAPVFAWKMIVANLEIAAIVVRPRLRVRPALVRARSDLATPEGMLMLSSSITLTPGTLSVDAVDGELYVHWVAAAATEDAEVKRQVLQPFEGHVKGIVE
jgi:multicomponent Na+:H+ antiporter subunit E